MIQSFISIRSFRSNNFKEEKKVLTRKQHIKPRFYSSFFLTLCSQIAKGNIIYETYPIGSASSLEVNSVAFMGEQGSVPVSIIGLIITNGERLSRLEAVCWKLCSEVVLRVQYGSVLEVNRHWVALQDFRRLFSSSGTFLLNNDLIDTRNQRGLSMSFCFI